MSRPLTKAATKMSKPPQKAPPFTHFLCIPLVTARSRPQLAEKLAAFQEDVTRPKSLGGFELPMDAVRPVGTLHFTLGMMSFPNDEGLDKAVDVLKSLRLRDILAALKEPILPGAMAVDGERTTAAAVEANPQLFITLKGLHSMHKPEKTTVLYVPTLDPLGALQRFGERLRTVFLEQGLMAAESRPLLLHATLVNTVYSKRKPNSRTGKKWNRIVIEDAQAMIDRYEDQVWMENVPLERVAICKMSAQPVLQGGEVVDVAYREEGVVCM